MKPYVILAACWFLVVYVSANAYLAVPNPGEWLRASWTAKRGINRECDPWDSSDIRALGVVFAAIAIGWGFLASNWTLALLRHY
jgi:hypothetical protein